MFSKKGTPKATRPGRGFKEALIFLGIGTELVIFTFAGYFAGYFMDKWLGTHPWLGIIGLIMGVTAGFVHFFRIARRFF